MEPNLNFHKQRAAIRYGISLAILDELVTAAAQVTKITKQIPSAHGNPFTLKRNRRPMKKQRRREAIACISIGYAISASRIRSIIQRPMPQYLKGAAS